MEIATTRKECDGHLSADSSGSKASERNMSVVQLLTFWKLASELEELGLVDRQNREGKSGKHKVVI